LTSSHYKGYVELQKKFPDGFSILAFPCNQYMGQEPGTPAQIKASVGKYGFEKYLFAKGDVKGGKEPPIWQWLNEHSDGPPGWNFGKHLIGKDGKHVKYMGPRDGDFKKIGKAVEAELSK